MCYPIAEPHGSAALDTQPGYPWGSARPGYVTKDLAPLDRLLTAEHLADALAPLGEDYAATLDATAELPATDRARARQKRRGLYLRLLRQTLRTAYMLKDGERW